MAIDSTPWFVGGGAQHSPEVARLLAYASTSGAEGVVEPASLRVSAQATPNGTVAVRPGAALLLNRYAGGGQQTYVLRNATSTSVTIPATGSGGGRTDAIIARVLDPQYEGAAPPDPVTFQYSRLERIGSVPGNLTRIEQLGLPYPAVLLAKVTIPASTGTITNGMITDLREVALPRTLDVWRPRPNVASDTEWNNITDPDGEWFPNNGGEQIISIPKWATRAQISATWSGVRYMGGRNPYGECWVEFGPYARPSTRQYSTQRFMYDSAGASANNYRVNWIAEDDCYVPAAIRGTDQVFVMKARKVGPDTGASIDGMSGVSLKVRFLEAADPSTS